MKPIQFCAILLILYACLPQSAAARESVSGSLERVMHQLVTILRPDGVVMDILLPENGKVHGEALAAKFKLGDIVEISYKDIAPVFAEGAQNFRRYELEKITFRHAPSRVEYASAVTSRAWRDPQNLLPPPDAAAIPPPQGSRVIGAGASETEALERARDTILKRLANMPNFTADETATRYTAMSASAKWELLDVVKSDIVFKGLAESRENVRQNDVPVSGGTRYLRTPHTDWRRGIQWNWGGSFGGRIRPLFDPECPVLFHFERRLTARGMQLIEFRFDTPTDSCFPPWGGTLRFYARRTGKILIEEATGELVQLEDALVGFPAGFIWTRIEHETVWDRVKIGEDLHLLPVSGSQMIYLSSGHLITIRIEYANHRHFEAKSNVTFQ